MQPIVYGDDYVYLYASMLYTRSPLLKWLYCESHAWEPWAVRAQEARYGVYRFPNVLYVNRQARDTLLAEIVSRLRSDPSYVAGLARRFEAEARCLPAGHLQTVARVLSVGVFKEVFEAPQALDFLSYYLPVEKVEQEVLALYQPACLPHFLKYELKLLFYAEAFARGDDGAVPRFVRYAAHHSRFLLEDTPLHDPAAARAAMAQVVSRCGSPTAIRRERKRLRSRHQAALAGALDAEGRVLGAADEYARMTLRSRLVVQQAIRFIRFIATWEELKHILVVEAAHRFRQTMDARGLDVETTGPDEFLRR